MFIKGNCAIYIDKNLKVYESSTGIFVRWSRGTKKDFFVSKKMIAKSYVLFKSKPITMGDRVQYILFKSSLQNLSHMIRTLIFFIFLLCNTITAKGESQIYNICF